MKVLNLGCTKNHRFEGWFASDDDFQSQSERGLMTCPLCGDTAVTRLPSAPHLNVSKAREPEPAKAVGGGSSNGSSNGNSNDAPVEMTMQAAWLRAVRHVMSTTVDVGDRFAEEARRIHYGEVDMRAIRGQATRDEAQALQDEGIEVVSFALPEALKGPIQ